MTATYVSIMIISTDSVPINALYQMSKTKLGNQLCCAVVEGLSFTCVAMYICT